MASLASVSSFATVKVPATAGVRATTSASSSCRVVCSAAGSPWQKAGQALVAAGAGLLVAAGAATAGPTVLLGGNDGQLAFVPSSTKMKSGDTITFLNNAGFPHNVIFDEDGVPSGVKADAISNEEYMNAKSEKYEVKLTVPGTYQIYCEPHQGAGMTGTITVE